MDAPRAHSSFIGDNDRTPMEASCGASRRRLPRAPPVARSIRVGSDQGAIMRFITTPTDGIGTRDTVGRHRGNLGDGGTADLGDGHRR